MAVAIKEKVKRSRVKRITTEKIQQFEAAFCPFAQEQTQEALEIGIIGCNWTVEQIIGICNEAELGEFEDPTDAILEAILETAEMELRGSNIYQIDNQYDLNDTRGTGERDYFLFSDDKRDNLLKAIKRAGYKREDFSKPTQFFLNAISKIK